MTATVARAHSAAKRRRRLRALCERLYRRCGNGHGNDDRLPQMRPRGARDDAHERLPVRLRMRRLRGYPQAPPRRLLRLLFLRGSRLSAEAVVTMTGHDPKLNPAEIHVIWAGGDSDAVGARRTISVLPYICRPASRSRMGQRSQKVIRDARPASLAIPCSRNASTSWRSPFVTGRARTDLVDRRVGTARWSSSGTSTRARSGSARTTAGAGPGSARSGSRRPGARGGSRTRAHPRGLR